MSSGTNGPSTRRSSREEIIELFQACAAKLNRTPGKAEFERTCGVSEADSIRDRSKFTLGDFERRLFAHKIIAT
jgi:hypothetical protein